ncbi:MAG TPA: type II toxin-antitoxin system PemK/MazF family toxin [Verrucomicrobiae bacterium]|nr:type II toxin-antitoxin system PemK/MazF family toxin [Verrucomicrobiae bacterium]
MAIQRGDIYLVNLNPVQGREQAGRRPVLVLSADPINRLPLVITVVIGTKGENVARDYPTNVRIPSSESGLPMETVFLCFQLRSLDPTRFEGAPAGKISGASLSRVEGAVRYCLGL